MTDTTYRTDGFATRRFPGWCVLIYARERGRSEIVQVVFDRDDEADGYCAYDALYNTGELAVMQLRGAG